MEVASGCMIELDAQPFQAFPPRFTIPPQTDPLQVDTEVDKLLQKRAVQTVEPCRGQFVSRLFTVPKKGGACRPVVNLRPLNKFVTKKRFKMENVAMLRDLLKEGDWMTSIDLKDAYLSVPIHEAPPFSVEGDTVRIPVPPIRDQQCPTHIHQALEASDGTAEKVGYQMCHFCGRSAPHGRVQVRADGGNPGGSNDVSAVGLPDQLGEISSDPVSAHQVSGVHGGLIGNDSDTSRGEAGEDHPGPLKSPEPTSPDSEIPRKADREDVRCHSGDPASSSVLPGVAEPEECSFQEVAVV